MPRRDHARKLSTGSTLGRRSARLAAIGLAALAAGVVAPPAQAQDPVGAGIGTSPIGPITEHFGFFPEFYTDALGRQLELCLDPADAQCLVALANPGLPISFPDNFLEEGFYWTAGADANGATLIMAQEATFDGIDGNQAVFGRLRVRIRAIPAGRYRFTTPYGQFEAVTDGKTDVGTDTGCGPAIGAPCDPITFKDSSGSAIGPNFLSNTVDPIHLGAAGAAPLLPGAAGGVSFSSNPALIDKVGPTVLLNVTAVTNGQDAAGTVDVAYNASGNDDIDLARPGSCPTAPDRLPAGATTTVTCQSSDLSIPPNVSTRTFGVTVPDTTPPVLTLPDAATTGAGNAVDGFVVNYAVSANDIVSGNRPVNCAPHATGTVFPVGATTVNCSASDAAGRTTTGSFVVTVSADGATAAVTGGQVDPVVVGNVVPTVAPNAQPAPPPILANFFRVDEISGPGGLPTTQHFGGTHNQTSFDITGKFAVPPVPFFRSTSGGFGSQHVGTPIDRIITIRNGGAAPMPLTTLTVTGSSDFALLPGSTCINNTIDAAPKQIPALVQETCTATVRFTPSAVAGRTGTLTATGGGTVALTGAGTLAAITTDKQGLSFGSQSVGLSTVPQTITITNTGGSPLTVGGVSFTGTAATDYNASPAGCTNVAPNGTCTVDVMFTPKAAGVRNATLQIATNEAGTKAVPVSGTGLAGPAPAGGGAAGGGGVIAPVITPQILAPVVPIDQPIAPSKKSLKSLTLKVGPARDRTLPLKFKIRGELKVPTGVSLKSTCAGTVAITLKRGLKTVVKSSPKLRLIANKKRCVYSSKVTIRSRALVGVRTSRLKVGVRYAGSSLLKAASRSKSVRIR